MYRLLFISTLFIISCREATLFSKVSSSHSGITFRNDIIENDSMNILELENIYNGGGVGIADFNNDGLPDIYFTGNMVENKLYLNKGDLSFQDITASAGVAGEDKWARGISIVDINNDGWQDMYISETIYNDPVQRENILYVNQGANKDGIPTFKNLAKEYGLNDDSHTSQSAFFDHDNDGDLDVYLAVNVFSKGENPNAYRRIFKNGEHPNTDRLYRNDYDSIKGHPYFTDVSREAGILQEGFAHSVTICDINLDGWKDVFVANDFLSENLLWINNRNGTFTNRSKEYFKHTSYNAMGADVVDINNDGLSDVIELDMNPEDSYRKKTMLGSSKYQTYLYNNSFGYQYQYIRNGLHLNMGFVDQADTSSHPVFGDIGFYAGIAETDWSWTPLVADFDSDGFRDIIITNGFPKDITDQDFMAYRNSAFAMNGKEQVLTKIPEVKIPNYAYRNTGRLKFENVTKDWGFALPTFSNGAAWSDLDNDGDLDVVINNINDQAHLYENKNTKGQQHYLKVLLKGEKENRGAFGSWIKVYSENRQQVYETNPVRGYLSSVENIPYFGLGHATIIDSVIVIWPDNRMTKIDNVKVDQLLELSQHEATIGYTWNRLGVEPLLKDVTASLGIQYNHEQEDYNDFAIQPLLPRKFSQTGPFITSGDINGDRLEDFIVGNANGKPATIFSQNVSGFEQRPLTNSPFSHLAVSDMGLQLFDADDDKDLDLYIARGGYSDSANSSSYQDMLYINDGDGNFHSDPSALPKNLSSKSCVRVADYDRDGDNDVFVGGRIEPWRYPKPVSSLLLRNDSEKGKIRFTEVPLPGLQRIGLVCDATWADYNHDGWPDLVIAGEWMPVKFLRNEKGRLVDETAMTGISDKTGFWNCIAAADINNDGLVDFVAGNIGENSFLTKEGRPVYNYYNDFDKNKRFESILTKEIKDKKGVYKEFTVHNRDEVLDQLPVVKKNFLSYASFAETPFSGIFQESVMEESYKLEANYFSSAVIINQGNGKFRIQQLPVEAQLSSISGICVTDFNRDSKPDLLLCGNDFSPEVFNGRLDAFNGLVMRGNGKGEFFPLTSEQSGLYIPGDAKDISCIQVKGRLVIVSTQNKGALKIFR